jgi:hypothetical protein
MIKKRKEGMNGLIYEKWLKKCTIQLNMVRKRTIGITPQHAISVVTFTSYI